MKNILIALFLPFTLISQMDVNKTLIHDGETRQYQVHLPPGFNANKTLPLVINMHGLGSNRTEQRGYTSFNSVADTADFIVVYPQGLPFDFGAGPQNHWNAGFNTNIDDIGFIDKMINEIIEEYNVDAARIYSTGMSNGGYMSLYLACELSDRIAAIASVTGSMISRVYNNCIPGRTVPIMQVHGTADATVAFLGTPTIPDMVESWVTRNKCNSTPVVEDIEDINKNDNTTAKKETYTDCGDDSEVWFYIIQDGGHTWPGAFPFAALGNTNQDFKASRDIWDFFNQFIHPNPLITTGLDQHNLQVINAYPNPVKNELILESNVGKVNVYNAQGRRVNVTQDGNHINTSSLKKGQYILISEKGQTRFIKV